MKLLGIRHLSVLLIGTLLLCHGVFGALHLVCDPLEWCIGGASIQQSTRPRLVPVTPTSITQVMVEVPHTSPWSPSACWS